MIKLRKVDEPEILRNNCSKWTKAVVGKIQMGLEPTKSEKSRYAHPDIKSALVTETHGKCAYCESKIRHTSYGDIEHVTPKSLSPELWFDWENLTLACDICNTRKSDNPGDADTFIDPYHVDPEEVFWHMGPLIYAKPGSDAALKTERLLGLNRAELIERRSERLRGLMKHLELIERVEDLAIKGALQFDFMEETKDDKEYAALAREVSRLAREKLSAV